MTRPLSPGVAFGCIELLGAVSREAFTPAGAESLALGSVPSRDILKAAMDLQWIVTSLDGLLVPAIRGERAISALDDTARLRLLVLDHIDAENPLWIQLAPRGRREVLLQAPKGVSQVLVEAGLAYGQDTETVGFWDALAARARGIRATSLSETGRIGERLSIEAEQKRTGCKPKWIALDSNADGYDVLSRVSAEDSRRLTIEVKTSAQGLAGFLHLTRNEWGLATESLNHVFHLWNIRTNPPRLAVLDTETVAIHIPDNRGSGEWEAAEIPFITFESSFSEAPL